MKCVIKVVFQKCLPHNPIRTSQLSVRLCREVGVGEVWRRGPDPEQEKERQKPGRADGFHLSWKRPTVFSHTRLQQTELHFDRSGCRPDRPPCFPCGSPGPSTRTQSLPTPLPPAPSGSQSTSHTFHSVKPDACFLLKGHQSQELVEEKIQCLCAPSPFLRWGRGAGR